MQCVKEHKAPQSLIYKISLTHKCSDYSTILAV